MGRSLRATTSRKHIVGRKKRKRKHFMPSPTDTNDVANRTADIYFMVGERYIPENSYEIACVISDALREYYVKRMQAREYIRNNYPGMSEDQRETMVPTIEQLAALAQR